MWLKKLFEALLSLDFLLKSWVIIWKSLTDFKPLYLFIAIT